MIFPIRCFTCGKLISQLWEPYETRLQEEFDKITDKDNKPSDADKATIENKVLEEFNITKYCCKRMFLSHVDLFEKI